MANQLAQPQQQPKNEPLEKFIALLNSRGGELKTQLPKSIPLEAFKRVVITALQEKPEILAAEHESLFQACLKCAKEGLLPDGKEAAFTIFNNNIAKKNEQPVYVKKVAYIPMVGGIKKRIWKSGEYTFLSGNVVYENDIFDYCLGDFESITHKPTMLERGEVVAAYAIAKNKSGEFLRAVLTRQDIDYIRSKSKSKDSAFWNDWYEQMAIKSAFRRLAKNLDLSVDFGDDDYDDLPIYDEPKKLAKPETPPALPKAEAAIEPEEPKPETKAVPQAAKTQAKKEFF
jgi:recombination protein RecT